ncbi:MULTISPECIES: hypothetical protein [unclassified Microbacterium]|uniref:hypothetical protein n=1 Tax=unclassified Microbacterium TaxID=2609290 RepID=UPI0030170612
MDEPNEADLISDEPPAEPPTDGIYTTCPICFAIAASGAGHEAWHASRGEGMTDADPERT